MDNNPNTRINSITDAIIANIADNIAPVAKSDTSKKIKTSESNQVNLNSIPSHVRTTHIDHVACPMHIVELTKNLKKIDVSETLRIIVGGCAVEAELQAACRTLGHKAIAIENNGKKELFVTRKV